MNEIFLFIIVLFILVASQLFVKKIKTPALNYIRISAAVALLILVWLFARESSIGSKVILSVVAFTVVYKEVLTIRGFN